MRLKKMHWIGIIFGVLVLLIATIFFWRDKNLLLFLIGIGLGVILLPFVVDLVLSGRKEEEINKMFLEFSRNLAESVNTGTPISKSIVNMKGKNYGSLGVHVAKLANQIDLGIPVDRALTTFSNDIGSPVIQRAVSLIGEAEKAGGEIDFILESVAKSIAETDKLNKERKTAISSLVVQGYIIFFIFIGIALVMQFKILPLTTDIGSFDTLNVGNVGTIPTETGAIQKEEVDIQEISRSFLYLLLVQGFFTGLTIGKLAEGKVKAGIKHSFILMMTAFLVSTGANLISV
jgi:archaeal flagellar protein FlaJ